MQRRVQWGLGIAVLLATASLGCGRQDTRASTRVPVTDQDSGPQTPSTDSPTSTVPTPSSEAELPVPPAPPLPSAPSAAESWWMSRPALPAMPTDFPACVPVVPPTGTRFAHPCSVKMISNDVTVSTTTYDAQGRQVRSEALAQTGTRTVETTAYDSQGHKSRQESYEEGRLSFFEDWTYDNVGRLTRYNYGYDVNNQYRVDSVYDSQGRLSRELHSRTESNGVSSSYGTWLFHSWLRYRYGEQGALVATDVSTDADYDSADWVVERTLTYHPNGQLWKDHDDYPLALCGCHLYEEYDEQGRLISDDRQSDENYGRMTYTLDDQGRQVESHTLSGSVRGPGESWHSQRYDDRGRVALERLIIDSEDSLSSPPMFGRQLLLNRYTYACETGEVLLQEQDTTGTGVRDGWHEWERDAAGNLLVERFHGSLIQSGYPRISRIEYDYSCQQ